MAYTAVAVLVHVPVQLCHPPRFCISEMVVELGVGEGDGDGVGKGEGFATTVPGAGIAEFDKLRLPPHPAAMMEINKATLKETANLSSYILGGRLSRVAQVFRKF